MNGCGTKAVGIGERRRNAGDVVFMKLTIEDAAVERGVHQRYGRAHVYTVYICEHLTDGTLVDYMVAMTICSTMTQSCP